MKSKHYYYHLFFILLIINFSIDMIFSRQLSWFSLFIAFFWTFVAYYFDKNFSVNKSSNVFNYEILESVDGRDFLRITARIVFHEDSDYKTREYVENVKFGLFGVAWGKPKAELRILKRMIKDLDGD